MEWEWIAEVLAYVFLAALAFFAVRLLVVVVVWLFAPSLTVDELNGFARLDRGEAGRGPEALGVFYGWRQDKWANLARGFGAAAVAVVLALVGATLESGKTVTERTADRAAAAAATKTTTTESETSPEAFALLGGFLVLGGVAWLRTRALHREFAADLGQLTPEP